MDLFGLRSAGQVLPLRSRSGGRWVVFPAMWIEAAREVFREAEFRSPAQVAALADAEHRLGRGLPDDLRQLLRCEVVDDAVGRRLPDSEQRCELSQRQVGSPVRRDQQDAVLQRQASGPAAADRVRSLTAQGGHQLAEVARAQPRERACP